MKNIFAILITLVITFTSGEIIKYERAECLWGISHINIIRVDGWRRISVAKYNSNRIVSCIQETK